MTHKFILECGGNDGTLKTHRVSIDGTRTFDEVMQMLGTLVESRGYMANLRIDREMVLPLPRAPQRVIPDPHHTYSYDEIG